MKKEYKTLLTVIIIGIVIFLVRIVYLRSMNTGHEFDGQRAFDYVKYQVGLGPRNMGSVAHDKVVQWISTELQNINWPMEIQETVISGQTVKNIIAKRGTGESWIIIASHYDSRLFADQDPNPENRKLPVPGANDGGSSTAILLELARVLPAKPDKEIWLVFFDDEDNGTASGTGWSVGSEYFVSQLEGIPDSVVVLDMVGDKNLNIYMEGNSNRDLNAEIWGVAQGLGYAQFIPTYKYSLIDDHIPFIKAGIPAVDVIDFDYAYWHTVNDTLDKVSTESLKAVGETILKWLELYPKKEMQIK